MPRSLTFCYRFIVEHLGFRAADYGERLPCHTLAEDILVQLHNSSVKEIFDTGLHEFLDVFIARNNKFGEQIARDYRFY